MTPESLLGIVGSVASIIGLSKQIYDDTSQRHPTSTGKYLAVFVTVTDLTSSWKKVHHQYHSNLHDLDIIGRLVFDSLNDVRDIGVIGSDTLRQKFQSLPGLGSFLTFESEVDHNLREIKHNIAKSGPDLDQHTRIIAKEDRHLLKTLEDIRYKELKFFEYNKNSCSYMNRVAPMLRESRWNEKSAKLIAEGFKNFFSDQHNCIMTADKILLDLITLLDIVSSQMRREN